jgi:translation elongation factor EF-G
MCLLTRHRWAAKTRTRKKSIHTFIRTYIHILSGKSRFTYFQTHITHVKQETGQLLLGGMGALHLEITRDRMNTMFGLNVHLGRMRVAYRETLGIEVKMAHETSRGAGDESCTTSITLSVVPRPENLDQPLRILIVDEMGRVRDLWDTATGRIASKLRMRRDGADLKAELLELSTEATLAIHTAIVNASAKGGVLGYQIQGKRCTYSTLSVYQRTTCC